jgi:hypothetical protein
MVTLWNTAAASHHLLLLQKICIFAAGGCALLVAMPFAVDGWMPDGASGA